MVNARIGKIYEFHFGKDIFVKYKILSLNNDFNIGIATLCRIENFYCGCDEIIYCEIDKLHNKRKIYEWLDEKIDDWYIR